MKNGYWAVLLAAALLFVGAALVADSAAILLVLPLLLFVFVLAVIFDARRQAGRD
jgi:hypothetical protein